MISSLTYNFKSNPVVNIIICKKKYMKKDTPQNPSMIPLFTVLIKPLSFLIGGLARDSGVHVKPKTTQLGLGKKG